MARLLTLAALAAMTSFAGATNSTTTTAMTTTPATAPALTMPAATTTAASTGMVTVVTGTVVLSVPNAQNFTQNQQAITAIATGIAQKAGVPGPSVAVRATVASSRRLAGRLGGAAPRLLQGTQNVNLDYRITPPAGTVAANIQATMQTVDKAGFQTLIQTALTNANLTIPVNVASVVAPTLTQVPVTTTTAVAPTTTAGKSSQTSAGSPLVGSRGLALAVVLALCTAMSA